MYLLLNQFDHFIILVIDQHGIWCLHSAVQRQIHRHGVRTKKKKLISHGKIFMDLLIVYYVPPQHFNCF